MERHSASLSESNTAIDKKEASLQSNRESDNLEVDYKSHCDEGFGEWGEWSACERIGEMIDLVTFDGGLILSCKAGISAKV